MSIHWSSCSLVIGSIKLFCFFNCEFAEEFFSCSVTFTSESFLETTEVATLLDTWYPYLAAELALLTFDLLDFTSAARSSPNSSLSLLFFSSCSFFLSCNRFCSSLSAFFYNCLCFYSSSRSFCFRSYFANLTFIDSINALSSSASSWELFKISIYYFCCVLELECLYLSLFRKRMLSSRSSCSAGIPLPLVSPTYLMRFLAVWGMAAGWSSSKYGGTIFKYRSWMYFWVFSSFASF